MLAGLSFGAGRASKKQSSAFDPTTSDPTGWWRANATEYNGIPFTPTASAGSSGSNGDLTSSSAPTTGTAVNGFTPASLNGTTHFFSLEDVAVGSLFSAVTAMTIIVLAKAAGSTAAAADFYDDPALGMTSGGNQGLVFTSSGVRFGIFDSGTKQTASISQSTGAWFMAAGRVDSGNVKCRVASGGTTTDATPVAIGTPGALGSDFFVGKNYASAKFFNGDILEIVTYSYAVSDSVLTNWQSYFNSRYALSL